MRNMLSDEVISQLSELQSNLKDYEDFQEEMKKEYLEMLEDDSAMVNDCQCIEPEFLHDENQWEPGYTCKQCQELADEFYKARIVDVDNDDLPF